MSRQHYQPGWLRHDLIAAGADDDAGARGHRLRAGRRASPASTVLYATIIPLLAWRALWPKLHPGAGVGLALAPLIAAVVLPLAAAAATGRLSWRRDGVVAGLFLGAGLARLGFITDRSPSPSATAI